MGLAVSIASTQIVFGQNKCRKQFLTYILFHDLIQYQLLLLLRLQVIGYGLKKYLCRRIYRNKIEMLTMKKIIFFILSLLLLGIIVLLLLNGYGETHGLLTLVFVIFGLLHLKIGLFKTKNLDKRGRSELIVNLFGMKGAFRFYIFFGIFCIILGIIFFLMK